MLRSYDFLHNAPPSLGAIAARPRFPLRRGTFFRSPSPPYAHPNSQTLDQRKKTVHFLDKCVHFRKKLHSFFSPRSTALFPFRHSSRAWARSLAHALSEFSFFAFTARRFAHNPLITSGLRVNPSPYLLHDTSSITHCLTIICGEGSGEGKKQKNGGCARIRARVVSFFTAVRCYPIGTCNTRSTKRAQSLFASPP